MALLLSVKVADPKEFCFSERRFAVICLSPQMTLQSPNRVGVFMHNMEMASVVSSNIRLMMEMTSENHRRPIIPCF